MDFKAIVKEQRQELKDIEKTEKIIERETSDEVKKFLAHPNILAITGVRRCGKSIFSYLLVKKNVFGYLNFDDERLVGTETKDLNNILQAFYELYGDLDYIVLDEIQDIDKWELFASRLRRTKKVIVAGSSSKLLSGELATHLTGRYIDVSLYPFSFREFLDLKQFKKSKTYTTKERAEIINYLRVYLKNGGFPEVDKFGTAMLPRIYNDIISKDVLLRYKIKKREELRKLAKYLITNFSEEISYSKLAKIFNVKHVSTISNWVSYLENSFLVIKLERFDFKLKQQFLAPKKVYCVDQGIINMFSFEFSKNLGRLMENIIAVELQREKSDPLVEVYYWKDYQQHEVDFVIKKGLKVKQLIQVTYASSKEDIKEREIDALVKASKELRCKNLIVITWDYESEEIIKKNKIKYIPLWKWLLEK